MLLPAISKRILFFAAVCAAMIVLAACGHHANLNPAQLEPNDN